MKTNYKLGIFIQKKKIPPVDEQLSSQNTSIYHEHKFTSIFHDSPA